MKNKSNFSVPFKMLHQLDSLSKTELNELLYVESDIEFIAESDDTDCTDNITLRDLI